MTSLFDIHGDGERRCPALMREIVQRDAPFLLKTIDKELGR